MFNAMHVRLVDYMTKSNSDVELCRAFGERAIVQSGEMLLQTFKRFKNQSLLIFVSKKDGQVCRELFRGECKEVQVVYMQDFKLGREFEMMITRTDQFSLASQVVEIHAEEFVVIRFPSYTAEMNNKRYLRSSEQTVMFFDDDK